MQRNKRRLALYIVLIGVAAGCFALSRAIHVEIHLAVQARQLMIVAALGCAYWILAAPFLYKAAAASKRAKLSKSEKLPQGETTNPYGDLVCRK